MLQASASLMLTSCACLCSTPRSSASIATMNAVKPTQSMGEPMVSGMRPRLPHVAVELADRKPDQNDRRRPDDVVPEKGDRRHPQSNPRDGGHPGDEPDERTGAGRAAGADRQHEHAEQRAVEERPELVDHFD